jgi:dolichyl-phosphate-mannose-protein mannosyltransferase
MEVALALAAAGFTYVVCLAAGKMLLQALRATLYRSEEYFFGFVLGSAIVSTLVFVLTALHLAYSGVFLATGAAILGLAVWRRAYRFSDKRLAPVPWIWRAGFALCYATFAVVYLEAALLPEIGPDAVLYHVALPARYLREHCFPVNTRNMMANLSEGIEMLFLFAYPLAKSSAGAMVHLVFTLVAPLGMLSYARRAGIYAAGVAGALLFFLSPIVGRLGTTGYVDVAVACVLFAVYYLFEIWRQERNTRLLVAVGLLAGFCFAAKYTAFLAVPYVLVLILWESWRARAILWRSIVITSVCAVATMAPYVVKNAVVIGNPVAPFGNRFFPNPMMTISLERAYAEVMRHWEGVRLADVPLEATIHGGRLQGVLGPVFLLAPLALMALRTSAGRRLLLAGAIFSSTYFASIATRFMVPSLPFLSLALASVLPRVALPVMILAHSVLSWPTVVARFSDRSSWRLYNLIWQDALRQRPDFLKRRLVEYETGLAIEKNVPPGQPVFAFGGFQQTYHSHEIIVSWQSAFANGLADALLTPVSPERLPTWRLAYDFPERKVRKLRLVQQDSRAEEEWSVTELRLLRKGVELPRAPAWRLRASHNIWTVQSAFDNNPVTRWTSGQPLSPGMWLEVDFGEERGMDSVVVECTGDQSHAPLRVEFENVKGGREILREDPAIYERRKPDGLRAAAAETFKLNHVYWILISTSDPYATEFASHPEEWNATLVVDHGHHRLYRLN